MDALSLSPPPKTALWNAFVVLSEVRGRDSSLARSGDSLKNAAGEFEQDDDPKRATGEPDPTRPAPDSLAPLELENAERPAACPSVFGCIEGGLTFKKLRPASALSLRGNVSLQSDLHAGSPSSRGVIVVSRSFRNASREPIRPLVKICIDTTTILGRKLPHGPGPEGSTEGWTSTTIGTSSLRATKRRRCPSGPFSRRKALTSPRRYKLL